MQNIKDALNWRYATKAYAADKKLSEEQVNLLLESAIMAPTSFGIQPFKIIHVKSAELREKLRTASWGQSQITDASELFVFAVPTNLNDADVDAFIQNTATTRNIPVESLAEYAGMIKGSINSRSEAEKINWSAKQAYIALGFMLETAAIEKIDTTPMEGFDTEQYNEILGLQDKNLTAVVVLAAGFRSEGDKYAELAKVRKSVSEIVEVK